MLQDTVFINNLASIAITGKDAWNRPTPQPITISVSLNTDFHQASVTDNLKYSLNYAVISRNIAEYMKANEHRNFKSLGSIAESVGEIVLDEKKGGGHQAVVSIKSNKSEIRTDSIEYKICRSRIEDIESPDEINVYGLKLLTVIGVFTFERLQRQIVDINISIKLEKNANISIHKIIDELTLYVESSNFKTVEALVMKIGQLVMQNHGDGVQNVSATVTKPNAITFTDGVGVSSNMSKASFKDVDPITDIGTSVNSAPNFNLPTSVEDSKFDKHEEHIAYIAIGSNQENQLSNINDALQLLSSYGIKLLATSSLYISKPMYFKDQPDFYNGAIKVSFKDKTPHELLKALKQIEYDHVKRVKEFENGPRTIDLDILLIDDIILNTDDLIIPHKSMLERTFVLQPLCELFGPDVLHPVSAEPLHNHSRQLFTSETNELIQESSNLLQIVPIPRLPDASNPLKFDHVENKRKTLIMGILNMTPDSFSDAGKNYHKSINEILENANQLIEEGADILDIGGVSTRPGSIEPSVQEELDRLLPVVKAIRLSTNNALSQCVISIDTYRAKIAEECLLAGADIINDISMGLYDDCMFDVVAKYGCPYIMNHTRGTPQTMSKLTTYESNTNEDIIEYLTDPVTGHHISLPKPDVENLINGVSRELGLQILKAFNKGVKKWQVVLDPGIGFAKNVSQNINVIKHASAFKNYSMLLNKRDDDNHINHSYVSFNGLSTLLGPSRKKFLGTICNEPVASERVISTAASIMACIQQNTDIIRVHDVSEMKKTCLTGDAIYKGIY